MTRSGKTKMWQQWVDRDDRKWLRKGLEHGATAEFLDSLHPYLLSIVTAAKYGSHTPNPDAPSKDFTQQVATEESARFAKHLDQQQVFAEIDQKWRNSRKKTCSLPLELSIEYLRFQAQGHSKSARAGFEEKDEAIADVSRQLVQSVDASISQIHDDDARLALELHFEGLVLPEISALTGIPAPVASALIAMSKSHVKEELKQKWGT